jgi:hypothetical protein
MFKVTALILLACGALLGGATHAIAHGCSPSVAQVVALDECDPDTFNLPIDKGGARGRRDRLLPQRLAQGVRLCDHAP